MNTIRNNTDVETVLFPKAAVINFTYACRRHTSSAGFEVITDMIVKSIIVYDAALCRLRAWSAYSPIPKTEALFSSEMSVDCRTKGLTSQSIILFNTSGELEFMCNAAHFASSG
jgi:hypothetical protein